MADRGAPDGRRDRSDHPGAYADLLAAGALSVAVLIAVVAASSGLATALATPLLALGPGYGLVLLVENGVLGRGASGDSQGGSGSVEESDSTADSSAAVDATGAAAVGRRVARVVGASLAVVSVGGLALGAAGLPTDVVAMTAWATATTVAFAAAAGIQRYRGGHPGPEFPEFAPEDGRSVGLFAVSAVFLLVIGAYLGVAAPSAEGFTAFSVQPPNGSDGGGLADPEFVPGEEATFVLEIGNREGENVNYTVVARVEVVEGTGENASVVRQEDEQRFRASVPSGDARELTHDFVPPAATGRVRVAYYLFRGEPPGTVTADGAYRSIEVWGSESG